MSTINNDHDGFFVTVEGLDKTGKTTQIRILKQYLDIANNQSLSGDAILDSIVSNKDNPDKVKTVLNLLSLQKFIMENGRTFVFTREPGGTNKAEDIRGVILEPRIRTVNEAATPLTEALLFAAARAQHTENLILPELKKGNVVICDRYIDSSLLYQGVGSSLGIEKVSEINKHATLGVSPDLTIFFKLEFDEWIKRITSKDNFRDNIESKSMEYLEKLYYGQDEVIELGKKRVLVVDGTGLTIDENSLKTSELLLNTIGNSYDQVTEYDDVSRRNIQRLVKRKATPPWGNISA